MVHDTRCTAHLIPCLVGEFDSGRTALDAGGMNEDMNPLAAGVAFENGECIREEVVGLLAVGEVGVDDRDGPAAGADGVSSGRWGLGVGVAENENEVCTSLREGKGNCCADTCNANVN